MCTDETDWQVARLRCEHKKTRLASGNRQKGDKTLTLVNDKKVKPQADVYPGSYFRDPGWKN